MSIHETPVLIIGAGPAGLAVAGRLRREGVPFEIIEKSQHVGNSWRNHYDRLHLHTIKELSNIPHLDFPEDYPRYVSRQQLVNYFEKYAAHFEIQPNFGQEVSSVKREGEGRWMVKTEQGTQFTSRHVVLATGVNRVPYRPGFDEEENFQGAIIHSAAYRNPEPFVGERVLVVGMGNTGAEIALDLCEAGIECCISVRGAVNIVPRDIFGRPTQLTALALAKLPHWLGDRIGLLVRRLVVGDLSKYGVDSPKLAPTEQLRVGGKTPVIDLGTISLIKSGKLKVLPGINHFTTDSVVFKDDTQHTFDSVILATGYRARVQDFLTDIAPILDKYDAPRGCIGEGNYAGLYFIGYDNYTPGGILGTIRRDSGIIAEQVKKNY